MKRTRYLLLLLHNAYGHVDICTLVSMYHYELWTVMYVQKVLSLYKQRLELRGGVERPPLIFLFYYICIIQGERMKHEKVIVIKNLFDPLEFDRDPGGCQNIVMNYLTYLRSKCTKYSKTIETLYSKRKTSCVKPNNF